jgi:hypothetical protein
MFTRDRTLISITSIYAGYLKKFRDSGEFLEQELKIERLALKLKPSRRNILQPGPKTARKAPSAVQPILVDARPAYWFRQLFANGKMCLPQRRFPQNFLRSTP